MFSRDNITWDNFVSDFSDQTNYIHGKKSSSETRLCEKTGQLLDVDGDICHHIHNTVKRFCSPFNNFPERLLVDLRVDSKFSTDIREALAEFPIILNILFKKPPQRISHRWLSCYGCTVTLISMSNTFYLFYISWLESYLHSIYKDEIHVICN